MIRYIRTRPFSGEDAKFISLGKQFYNDTMLATVNEDYDVCSSVFCSTGLCLHDKFIESCIITAFDL